MARDAATLRECRIARVSKASPHLRGDELERFASDWQLQRLDARYAIDQAGLLPQDSLLEHFDDPDSGGLISLALRTVHTGRVDVDSRSTTIYIEQRVVGAFHVADDGQVITSDDIRRKAIGLYFEHHSWKPIPCHFVADVEWFRARHRTGGSD